MGLLIKSFQLLIEPPRGLLMLALLQAVLLDGVYEKTKKSNLKKVNKKRRDEDCISSCCAQIFERNNTIPLVRSLARIFNC